MPTVQSANVYQPKSPGPSEVKGEPILPVLHREPVKKNLAKQLNPEAPPFVPFFDKYKEETEKRGPLTTSENFEERRITRQVLRTLGTTERDARTA